MNSTMTPTAEIASEYIDAHGQLQSVSAVTRQRLLAAMHPAQPHASPLPPVLIVQGEQAEIVLPAPGITGEWQLIAEQGERWQGRAIANRPIALPALPLGYHQLSFSVQQQAFHCRIIVAPVRCYEPPAIQQGQSLWGACIQLYTLRSASNWGIGDFSDLKQMLVEVAQRGGACIGLNPLHALFPATPESASPYSPSSRRWLNMLYIDVAAVEDFTLSEEAQRWWQATSTQQALQAARDAEWVDYSAVTHLKLEALRLAWQQFRQRGADDGLVVAFECFMQQGGESLLHQGVFDALHAAQIAEAPQRYDWTTWPAALQSPDSAAVRAFRIEHTYEVRFYLWLQWLAARQFADCWAVCQQQAMPIGLYRDLAVGVAQGGAETWSDRELYCLQASVGAPPDILGPLGQNWGLPPMDPQIMQARAYQPWIDLLRANMHDCGALRIDHVMALLRLWWIPQGESAAEGAYVHYPIDDLLAILALESQRHHCMVIGEDLGTVPEKIIGKLYQAGVYSYKVLYFEQTSKVAFRAPDHWPRQAMAVATTHDMPTLRGWWQSDDLRLGSELGLYPDKQILAGLNKSRLAARRALIRSLQRSNCLPEQAEPQVMDRALSAAMQRYLADSNSALLGLQPEEWLDMASPVNIPGTTRQYPNWRRKLSASLEAMFADPQINALLADIDQRRRNA
ncbi:4-alpha-glucanotransferase [Pantoea endophytica]|uniref:4-alpha-glucanotransferase n=1 Tax=Pantoea endophytica TaxID=92488 RepID=A0ABX4SUC5_9GAMM|nr:4-alpha-glucanotransferase [Pantoea endophytica]PLR25962.1 4-alpha-glucanotransferase [Pantoea endophytica]